MGRALLSTALMGCSHVFCCSDGVCHVALSGHALQGSRCSDGACSLLWPAWCCTWWLTVPCRPRGRAPTAAAHLPPCSTFQIGALSVIPSVFVVPCLLHLVVSKPGYKSWLLYADWIIAAISLVVGVMGTYSSIYTINQAAITFKVFSPTG